MRKLFISIVFMCICTVSMAGMQEDRQALIQKLINAGIFQKVDIPGNLPHLWVRPGFYALDFDQRQTFVSVVYAYYFAQNSSYNMVILHDSKSGKKVGKYSPTYGGLRMDD